MWRYTGAGQGAYLPGLPAADLTDAEWADLPAHIRATGEGFGLYEHIPDKPEKAAKAAPAEAAPAQKEG